MSIDLLTGSLWANAAFSATSGATLVLGRSGLGQWLGLPEAVVVVVGLGLVLFAATVALVARRRSRREVQAVIAADAAWVIGAAVVLAAFPDVLSAVGAWALAGVSIVVLDLAIAQSLGLRRLARAA